MTSHNPNDEREGYCGNCHDWTGQRQLSATGPTPGTYVISVEIPAEIDAETAHRLETAFAAIAHNCIPGAFTSGYRVRGSNGKHGSTKGSNAG
jgi:hypothetical protein